MADKQAQAAKKFAAYWKGKGYEKGESQLFWISLLHDVFGVEHLERFVEFEDQVHLDNTSFIDAMIPSTRVMIEQTTYTTKQVWVQDSAACSQFVCKVCGYTTRSSDDINLHNLDTGHTYKTQSVAATGHYETGKVASGSKCSVCGATK